MKTKYYLLLWLLSGVLLTSCAGTPSEPSSPVATLVVTPSVPQEQFFADFVENVEVIPLQTREDLFIRNKRVMELYKGDVYISNVDNGLRDDSRGESNVVLRFDSSGRFLNKIGNVSRGSVPGTYYFYANYYLDSLAYIFSFHDFCVNKYTLAGDFISKDTLAVMREFKQAAHFKGGYVLNSSSDTPRKHLLQFYDECGEKLWDKVYLQTSLRSMYDRKHNFTKYGDTLLYCDSQKDTIYQISDKGMVTPRVFVDYGEARRSHKEAYLRDGKNGSDFDEYVKKPSADNHLYYESENYCLLEVLERKPTEQGFQTSARLALKNKQSGQLSFVDFDKENTLFDGAVQFLEGKKLYFLVQARHLTPLPEWMRAYFVNPQVLEGVKAEDNDLIFVFTLK